ncbi:hypothetical protein ACS0TY_000787 [Phlomoides rotata]
MFAEFTCNGISRDAVGRKYSESESSKKNLQLLMELMEMLVFRGLVGLVELMVSIRVWIKLPKSWTNS